MQWWNSLDTVSRLNTLLQVTGAVIGVLIVTFGMRLAKLQTRMEWQSLTDDQITEWAKTLAPYNLTGLYLEKIDSNSDKLAGSLWKVGKKLNFSPSIQVNSYGPGITILASANYGAGNALVNLFASSLGYAAVLKSERMSDPTSVMIFIGEKP